MTVITIVDAPKYETSKNGAHHWWIVTDDAGKRYKIWDGGVKDAVQSLAASGPIDVDIEVSEDAKFFDKIIAARPTRTAADAAYEAQTAQAQAAPAGVSVEEILGEMLRDIANAALKAEARLTVPF